MKKNPFPGFSSESDPRIRARHFFSSPPVVETPRLILRPLRKSDARDLFSWCSDPEVAVYVLWEPHQSLSETRSYIRYIRRLYREGRPSSWGLVDRESQQVIGTIGLMFYSPENRSCEIGYSLSRFFWGRGLMTEAVSAFIHLFFHHLDLNRIEAQHDIRNPRSGRVLEKCGMQREGILRSRIMNKGEPVDVMLWSVLRSDQF